MVFLAATTDTRSPATYFSIVANPRSSFETNISQQAQGLQVQPTGPYKKETSPRLWPTSRLTTTGPRRIVKAHTGHDEVAIIVVNSGDEVNGKNDSADGYDKVLKQKEGGCQHPPSRRIVQDQDEHCKDHHVKATTTSTGQHDLSALGTKMSRLPGGQEDRFRRQWQQQQGHLNPQHVQQQPMGDDNNAFLTISSVAAAAATDRRNMTTGTSAMMPLRNTDDLHLSRPVAPPPPTRNSLVGIVPSQNMISAGAYSSHPPQDPHDSEFLLSRRRSSNYVLTPDMIMAHPTAGSSLGIAEEELLLLQQQRHDQQQHYLLLREQHREDVLLHRASKARRHFPHHYHQSALDLSSQETPSLMRQVSHQDDYGLRGFQMTGHRFGREVPRAITSLSPHNTLQQHLGDPTSTVLMSPLERDEPLGRQRMLSMSGEAINVTANTTLHPSSSFVARVSSPVIVPRSEDVLCGRGRGVGSKPGNIYYNQLIQSKRRDYRKLEKKEKQAFAAEIHKEIVQRGGRFLCYDFRGQWKLLAERLVLEKICTALRKTSHANSDSKEDKHKKKKKQPTVSKREKKNRSQKLSNPRVESDDDEDRRAKRLENAKSSGPKSSFHEADKSDLGDGEGENSSEDCDDDDDETDDGEDTETEDEDDDDDDDDDGIEVPKMLPPKGASATSVVHLCHEDASKAQNPIQAQLNDIEKDGDLDEQGKDVGKDNNEPKGALAALSEIAVAMVARAPEDCNAPDTRTKRLSISSSSPCGKKDVVEVERRLPAKKRQRRSWVGKPPSNSSAPSFSLPEHERKLPPDTNDNEGGEMTSTSDDETDVGGRPPSESDDLRATIKSTPSSLSLWAKGDRADHHDGESAEIASRMRMRREGGEKFAAAASDSNKGTVTGKRRTASETDKRSDGGTNIPTVLCCSTCHLPLLGSASGASSQLYCTCTAAGPAMLIHKAHLLTDKSSAERQDEAMDTTKTGGSGNHDHSHPPSAMTFPSKIATAAGAESTTFGGDLGIPGGVAAGGVSLSSAAPPGIVLPPPPLTTRLVTRTSAPSSLSEPESTATATATTDVMVRHMEEQPHWLHSGDNGQLPSSALTSMFPRTGLSQSLTSSSLARAVPPASAQTYARQDMYSRDQPYLRHHHRLNQSVFPTMTQGFHCGSSAATSPSAAASILPSHHQHGRMHFCPQQQSVSQTSSLSSPGNLFLSTTNHLLSGADASERTNLESMDTRSRPQLQVDGDTTRMLRASDSLTPSAASSSSLIMERVVTPSSAGAWQKQPLTSFAPSSAPLFRHPNAHSSSLSPLDRIVPSTIARPNRLAPGSGSVAAFTIADGGSADVIMAETTQNENSLSTVPTQQDRRHSWK